MLNDNNPSRYVVVPLFIYVFVYVYYIIDLFYMLTLYVIHCVDYKNLLLVRMFYVGYILWMVAFYAKYYVEL